MDIILELIESLNKWCQYLCISRSGSDDESNIFTGPWRWQTYQLLSVTSLPWSHISKKISRVSYLSVKFNSKFTSKKSKKIFFTKYYTNWVIYECMVLGPNKISWIHDVKTFGILFYDQFPPRVRSCSP